MDNIPLGSSTPPPVFSTPPPVSIPPIQPETPKRGISWKIIAGILAVLVLIAVLALNYFNILPWKNYTSKSGTSIGKSQAVSSPSPLPAASTNATTVFSNYIKSVLKPVYQGQGDLDIKILTLPDKDYDTYTSTKYFDNAIIVANYSVGKGGQFAKDVPIEINVLVFETTGKDSKDLTS
ncbi:MAG: hypothetical protein Q7S45_02355, partial [Candidatus Curtissbacteria bacterium]|nr:hypothetical protein [Candidatus Curtissbacteria bacterium]